MTITHPQRSAPEATRRLARQRRQEATKLLAAFGASTFVDIPVPTQADVADLRKAVDFAKRHGLVPVGHRLEKEVVGNNLIRIKLVAGSHANTRKGAASVKVPIPADLSALEPCIARIRDANDQLQIPSDMRRRALLLLQAMAADLGRRGFAVSAPGSSRPRSDDYYGWATNERAGRIETVIGGVTCTISVTQNSPFSTDPIRASRIAVEVWPRLRQGQHSWVDGQRHRVEDRIVDILAALSLAAAEAAREREQTERERVRRQARWEGAMARAKHLAIEERHLRVLRQNVDLWKFVQDLGTYASEMRRRLARLPEGEDSNVAAAWIDWADQFLARYDPIHGFPDLPDADTEPTDKELEAYLGGLSPYGPYR